MLDLVVLVCVLRRRLKKVSTCLSSPIFSSRIAPVETPVIRKLYGLSSIRRLLLPIKIFHCVNTEFRLFMAKSGGKY